MKRRVMCALLALCLCLTLLPGTAFAAEPATETADFTASDDGAAAIALLNQYKNAGAADSTWDNSSKTLTLRGIDTVEAAMPLKGKAITVRRDSVHLKKGEYFYQDLYGFQVFDLRRNAVIGTLAEVLERPASMLYRVTGPLGEILIPAVEPFRREIRLEERQIVVSTIEGMLPDEN